METPFIPVFASPTSATGDPVASDVVELALLLPLTQATALENAAHQYGISTGQLLRRIIKSSLATLNAG